MQRRPVLAPDRRDEFLVTVPRAAIISVMPFWLSPGPGDCTRLRHGRDVRLLDAAAGIVECRETSLSARGASILGSNMCDCQDTTIKAPAWVPSKNRPAVERVRAGT